MDLKLLLLFIIVIVIYYLFNFFFFAFSGDKKHQIELQCPNILHAAFDILNIASQSMIFVPSPIFFAAAPELQDDGSLLKLVQLLGAVMRAKGLEVEAAKEEVRERQMQSDSLVIPSDSSSELDLVKQVMELEKSLRHKEEVIERLKQQASHPASPSIMTEVRHLKDELENVEVERNELRQSLEREKDENKILIGTVSSEKLKFRKVERQLDEVQHNLEENRKQLQWQREQGAGVVGRGTVEPDFRERMKKKDMEMAKQLDKIEVRRGREGRGGEKNSDQNGDRLTGQGERDMCAVMSLRHVV